MLSRYWSEGCLFSLKSPNNAHDKFSDGRLIHLFEWKRSIAHPSIYKLLDVMNFLHKFGLLFFAGNNVDQEYIWQVKDASTGSKKLHCVFCVFLQFLDQNLASLTGQTGFHLLFMKHRLHFALRVGKWAIFVA